MAKSGSSKYIEMCTMSFAAFSKSEVGSVAKYLLSPNPNSAHEVSKSIKSACSKNKTLCEIKTKRILVEQDGGEWLPSQILEATLISIVE